MTPGLPLERIEQGQPSLRSEKQQPHGETRCRGKQVIAQLYISS